MKMEDEEYSNSVSEDTSVDDVEIEPLTGKPYFHVIMQKSHFTSYHMIIPVSFLESLPKKDTAPMILTYGSGNWEMTYSGHEYTPKRFTKGWKKFVKDTKLKMRDVCIFELLSSDHEPIVRFKVQILRYNVPAPFRDREPVVVVID